MTSIDTFDCLSEISKKPISYLLIKLTSICNISCSYCYWFRDPDVLDGSRIFSNEIASIFYRKLESHLINKKPKEFSILFHGGEPLIYPKKRFIFLIESINAIGLRTNTKIYYSITSNGILIDEQWCAIFLHYKVSVTVSFDGPSHDKSRVDKQKNGTAIRVRNSILFLRSHGITPGILSVCDPVNKGKEFYNYMVKKNDINNFDVLMPDVNWETEFHSVSKFYIELFDSWYLNHNNDNVHIRTFTAIIRGLFGLSPNVESFGYGCISTTTLLPNGALEPLDVLRANGGGFTKTNVSIIKNEIQDIVYDDKWISVAKNSLQLCSKCNECEYRLSCGGGFLPHRWSKENGYINTSRYCDDIKKIYSHIWNRIDKDYEITPIQNQMPPLSKDRS